MILKKTIRMNDLSTHLETIREVLPKLIQGSVLVNRVAIYHVTDVSLIPCPFDENILDLYFINKENQTIAHIRRNENWDILLEIEGISLKITAL